MYVESENEFHLYYKTIVFIFIFRTWYK